MLNFFEKRKNKKEQHITSKRNKFLNEVKLEYVDQRKCKLGMKGSRDLLTNFIPDHRIVTTKDIAELLEKFGYITIFTVGNNWAYRVNQDHNIYAHDVYMMIKNEIKRASNACDIIFQTTW